MAADLDPVSLDWGSVDLPAAWVDQLNFLNPADFWKFLSHIFGRPRAVVLPLNLPGGEQLPGYLLQEFHRMPNGNFSTRMAKGYRHSFETSMLGALKPMRQEIARRFSDCHAALDLGCGAGDLAGALAAAGVKEVWALDPCPYLLKEGALRFGAVNFVQGVAEKMPFADGRFDAVAVSFLFHELPSVVADLALAEIGRVMQVGGELMIVEPSPLQMQPSNLWQLLCRCGWRGLYYKLLAKFVFEPFVLAWHRKDLGEWLRLNGFEVLDDTVGVPLRKLIARKCPPVQPQVPCL